MVVATGPGRRLAAAAAALAFAAGARAGAAAPDAPPLPGSACVDGFGGFGHAVELSADGALLAVGAPWDSSAGAGALHPGDPGFAEAMAGIGEKDPIDDESARHDWPPGGWRSGAVHVFRLGASGRWELEAYLKAAEPDFDDLLGGALAMDAAGATLAAGPGPVQSTDHWEGGRGASVFRRSASGRWELEARLEPPLEGRHDRFGWSLALSGDGSALAAGAERGGPEGAGGSLLSEASEKHVVNKGERDAPGAVRVYRRSESGRWALEAIVEAPAPGAGDEFGEAVALDGPGDALAVGAGTEDGSAGGARMAGDSGLAKALADEGAPDSGAAYLFRRSGPGRWELEAYVKAPAPGRGDWFGSAVSLDAAGEALAVAAPREDSAASGAFRPGGPPAGQAMAEGGSPGAGAAYLYRRSESGRWELEARAKAPGEADSEILRPGSSWWRESRPRLDGARPALALSADGAALAASALRGAGASAGLGGSPGERCDLGAAQVHRRAPSGDWSLAAWTGSSCPPGGHGAERLADDVALSAGGLLAMGVAGGWRGSACALRVAPEAEAPAAAAPAAEARAAPAPPARPWPRGVSAYLKAPVPVAAERASRAGGRLGHAVALSADGVALAATAVDGSTATGALHPGDAGFAGGLLPAGRDFGYRVGWNRVAHVYRRAASGRWAQEARVVPPAGAATFHGALALSADGSSLALGAERDDSPAAGALHPGDPGFAEALAGGGAERAGAVYAYRRSASGRWALEAYVKAPVARAGEGFGDGVALSADGGALVGTGHSRGRGAAHVYRRSASGRWAHEARVAPPAGGSAFSGAAALSAGGSSLALGARWDGSPAGGVFRPGGSGFAAALAGEGAERAGAVYVYRRSASGRWALEAYAKAPAPRAGDGFGEAVALDAAGEALAVAAPSIQDHTWPHCSVAAAGPSEGGSAGGVFHPGDPGLREAVAGAGAERIGAVYVYRRSVSGRWALEAYAKAPAVAECRSDVKAHALALSAGGGALAVGATWDNSPAAGAFRRGAAGFAEAQAAGHPRGLGAARNIGGARVYRRSASGRWALGVYVKAPAPGAGDDFGMAVALSGDGSSLAVSAPGEDGPVGGVLHPGDPGFRGALSRDGAENSGAVFLYELRP